MNKYQEALDKLLRIAGESPNAYNIKPEYMVLKELVDKATPKKPLLRDLNEYVECPKCESPLEANKYCGECGQALYWSEE